MRWYGRGGFFGAALLLPQLLVGQSVQGRITNAATGQPVPAVSVEVVNAADSTVARVTGDSAGAYAVGPIDPGIYRARFRAPGYHAVFSGAFGLGDGETADVSLQLSPLAAYALDTVVVEGKRVPRYLQGFYRRSHFGWGTFVTAAAITGSPTRKFTDLTSRFPGFIVKYDQIGHRTISNNKRELHQGVCAPLVYIDGALVGDTQNYDMDTIRVDWIAAIEAYNSPAFTPLEFNTADATCGVIVIWLKRGAELRP
jgi:hypothetical protein